MADNPFVEFAQRYGNNATLFVAEVLGMDGRDDQHRIDPEQRELLDALSKGERGISIKSGHGCGKGHSVDTMVDTPDGVRRWGDLVVGDRLFGTAGDTRITGVFKRGVLPVFRVTFSDGTWTVVDGDHLWTLRGRRGSVQTLETREIYRQGTHRSNGRLRAARWRLPSYRAVEYSARAPYDPYLFGYWIGDGSRGGKLSAGTTICADVPGVSWKPCNTRPTVSSGTAPGLSVAVRESGLADSLAPLKFVPAQYKYTTAADRHALLQGLLDTDGTADKRGMVTFCSTSARLCDDVAWLVRSLGGVASRHPTAKKPFYRNENGEKVVCLPAYTVSLILPEEYPPFRLPLKASRMHAPSPRGLSRYIVDIRSAGEADVVCVSVDAPDSLYLTNDFIVTHNTAALAWAIVWHNCCRYPQRVVATAPTGGQLFGALAKETNIWLKKLPPPLYDLFDIKSESFNLKADPDDSNTEYRTSRAETPEALAGVHAESGWVLLIADEASGVPDEVFESASGSMSAHNATTILAGNPVRLTGLFYDTHTKLKDYWHTIHMSCIGHRRVSPQYVEDMRRRYGENSNQYRVRVLGEFPKADNDAVIPRDLMELARVRDVQALKVRPIWGVDVGGGGKASDASALVKRIGNVVPEHPLTWHNLEPMQLVGRIKQEWDNTPNDQRPSEICVDSIGMGASVATRLNELNLPARGINVAESPSMKEQYASLKAELWWTAREWFQARDCAIPPAPKKDQGADLGDELCAVNFDPPTSNGKVRIEPKDKTRKRLGHSPDAADAFILTFAVSAVSALYGSTGSQSWKEPLQRDIKWLV